MGLGLNFLVIFGKHRPGGQVSVGKLTPKKRKKIGKNKMGEGGGGVEFSSHFWET